jgi:Predicted transcription factor, homolog of eukaryotic MBF1
MKQYGEMIIAARGAKGMSQTDLAKEVGISRPALSNIERGISKPSPVTWYKIAQALEIELPENEQRATSELTELMASHSYCRGVLYAAIADIIGDNPTRFQNCSRSDTCLMQAMAMAGQAKPHGRKEEALMKAACDIKIVDETHRVYTLEEQGQFQIGYYQARAK